RTPAVADGKQDRDRGGRKTGGARSGAGAGASGKRERKVSEPMRAMENPGVSRDAPQQLIDTATEGMLGPNPFIGFSPQDIAAAFQELAHQALVHPAMMLEREAAFLRDLMAIASGSSKLAAAPGDKRFTDPAWQHNPLYRICLQTYLAWTNSVTQLVD